MVDTETLLGLLSNPPRAKAIYNTGQLTTGVFAGWKLGHSYQMTVVPDGVIAEVDGLYKVDYDLGTRYKDGATSSYGLSYVTVNGVRQSSVGAAGQQGYNQSIGNPSTGAMVCYGGHTYLSLTEGDKVGVELAGTTYVPTPAGATGAACWLTVEYWSPGKA